MLPTLINPQDGLQGNEFSIRSNGAIKGKDGELYFVGKKGLTVFDPLTIKLNKAPPPVVLTSIKLFNKEYENDISPGYIDQLDLSWKDNMLSINFAALDYNSPGQNSYMYKMEGFDNDWIDAGNHNSATYTNLDGGNYTFRVKAANNHDIWNENHPDKTAWDIYDALRVFSGNLANGPAELAQGWVVIGDLGWYDYSFGSRQYAIDEFDRMKINDRLWQDKDKAVWQKSTLEMHRHFHRKLEKQLDVYTPADLGVEVSSHLTQVKVEPPAERQAGIKVEDVDQLVDKLKNEAKVIS